MTFTVDQPMAVATLKTAMIIAPTQPKEKREIVIWRRPSLGPMVEKKATGSVPSTLKRIIAMTLSQKPSWKIGTARAPRATVGIDRFADAHIVKLSRMRTWVLVSG